MGPIPAVRASLAALASEDRGSGVGGSGLRDGADWPKRATWLEDLERAVRGRRVLSPRTGHASPCPPPQLGGGARPHPLEERGWEGDRKPVTCPAHLSPSSLLSSAGQPAPQQR